MTFPDRVRNYFRASKEELFAVTWPTRQDIIRYTGLVIVTVIIFGIFFTALDFVVNKGIQVILSSKTAQTVTPDTTTAPTNPIEDAPVQVEATDANGNPTDIKVEQVPVTSATGAQAQP